MKTLIVPANMPYAQVKKLLPHGGKVYWVHNGKKRRQAVKVSGGA